MLFKEPMLDLQSRFLQSKDVQLVPFEHYLLSKKVFFNLITVYLRLEPPFNNFIHRSLLDRSGAKTICGFRCFEILPIPSSHARAESTLVLIGHLPLS